MYAIAFRIFAFIFIRWLTVLECEIRVTSQSLKTSKCMRCYGVILTRSSLGYLSYSCLLY